MADKAIAAYEKARSLDPSRASAYNNLANIHYTIGHTSTRRSRCGGKRSNKIRISPMRG